MSDVEQFDPLAEQGAAKISRADLEGFINIAMAGKFDGVESQFSALEKTQLPVLMKTDRNRWFEVAEELSSDEIRSMAKFFTLVEEKIPSCEAADKSPVIWLCKVLKKRGEFPDKELTRWIKSNTSNRFLPYGSVL